MKRTFVIILVLVLIAAAGFVFLFRTPPAQRTAQPAPREQRIAAGVDTTPPGTSTGQPNPRRGGNRGRNNALQDPAAREALSFVGADAVAEEYWLKAINNPGLPAKERQDLIEDLNEEGFADPKNLTENDLPLIVSRLAILELLHPMDEVNAAAIKEAYKDLSKMRANVLSRRKIVQ